MSKKSPCISIAKQFALAGLFFFIALAAKGQGVPQYIKADLDHVAPQGSARWFFAGTSQTLDTLTGGRKWQMIFYPRHFPTAPKGYIKAIYLRNGPQLNGRNGLAYNIRFSIGHTTRDTFKSRRNGGARDTLITGLTPVYTAARITQNLKDSAGYWKKFPLTGNFYYDTSQSLNMIVEFSFGPPWPYALSFLDSFQSRLTTLISYLDSTSIFNNTNSTIGPTSNPDFGFDLGPTPNVSVPALPESTIGYPYPNPATTELHVPLLQDWSGAADVAIYTVDGRRMAIYHFPEGPLRSGLTLSTAELPPGAYFAEISLGKVVVRRKFTRQ